MDDSLPQPLPLSALAEQHRARRSGVLAIGTPPAGVRLLLREGQIVGVAFAEETPKPAAPAPLPRPDDSARLRLERVLEEVGIRAAPKAKRSFPVPVPGPRAVDPRERVLEALVDPSLDATFEDGAGAEGFAEAAGATEPLILEAVRRIRDEATARAALGDIDQRLVATTALAEERTLTLTEGYILSRIDGTATARQVLQLVPLDPDETERTLLGLLLIGRVEFRANPAASRPATAATPPPGPLDPGLPADASEAGSERPFSFPEATEVEPEPEGAPPAPGPERRPEMDPQMLAWRKEIVETFNALPLKNHFQVLGVEPGCADADVKRAYVSLTKRFHPDVHNDPRLEDVHDLLAGILIRVGEAWEVLGEAKSRASYEARLGVAGPRRDAAAPLPPVTADSDTAGPAPGADPRPPAAATRMSAAPDFVPPEETLLRAQLLIGQARYWDAIQVLEAAVPRMAPARHQNRGRILLARAYAKNPNWLRRAEETLQDVVRQDPANVDAHFELGLVYKASGLAARAQAQFRRVVELRPDHREAAIELGPPEPGGGGLLKRLFGRGKAS